MNEADIYKTIEAAIATYEKRRIENFWTSKTKTFVVKHFTTLVICVLLFWCFGGGTAVKNYASGWFSRMFNVQINNAVIQRIIPDGGERTRFIERITKLFERDYANDDQFESDYRQTTADFRYKYPALREQPIRNKEQLANFVKGE